MAEKKKTTTKKTSTTKKSTSAKKTSTTKKSTSTKKTTSKKTTSKKSNTTEDMIASVAQQGIKKVTGLDVKEKDIKNVIKTVEGNTDTISSVVESIEGLLGKK